MDRRGRGGHGRIPMLRRHQHPDRTRQRVVRGQQPQRQVVERQNRRLWCRIHVPDVPRRQARRRGGDSEASRRHRYRRGCSGESRSESGDGCDRHRHHDERDIRQLQRGGLSRQCPRSLRVLKSGSYLRMHSRLHLQGSDERIQRPVGQRLEQLQSEHRGLGYEGVQVLARLGCPTEPHGATNPVRLQRGHHVA